MASRGGFRGGRGSYNSRGGGNSRGGYAPRDFGPPQTVYEMGKFVHACEGSIVCESINQKIPHFNAAIYLENKTSIGKVDEVLGPINQVFFSVKPSEGIQAGSFKAGDKFYISGDKLLPLEKFLPKPKPPPGTVARVRKPSRGGAAGGRGEFSRGGSRGGPRGGGFGRGGPPRGRGGFSSSRGGFSRVGGSGGFSSRGGSGGFSGGRSRGGFSSRGGR